MDRLLLSTTLAALADGRAANCTGAGNFSVADDDRFNGTTGNGTSGACDAAESFSTTDMGMVKVGVLTAVLVVVMISTCRLLFKMYAQFGMRDSPDSVDKGFGE